MAKKKIKAQELSSKLKRESGERKKTTRQVMEQARESVRIARKRVR